MTQNVIQTDVSDPKKAKTSQYNWKWNNKTTKIDN